MSTTGVRITLDRTPELAAALRQMRKRRVLVGIPDSSSARGGAEPGNAEIGYQNEFGSPAQRIPPRPHLVPATTHAVPQIASALERAAVEAFRVPPSRSLDDGLEEAGLLAQSAVKNYIVAQTGFRPLSPYTLAQRAAIGFAGKKALIHTGQYLNSITYVIKDA